MNNQKLEVDWQPEGPRPLLSLAVRGRMELSDGSGGRTVFEVGISIRAAERGAGGGGEQSCMKCSFCSEEIVEPGPVCRYCGSSLQLPLATGPAAGRGRLLSGQRVEHAPWRAAALLCLGVILITLLLGRHVEVGWYLFFGMGGLLLLWLAGPLWFSIGVGTSRLLGWTEDR